HVLAEGHELDLVVRGDLATVGRDEVGPVELLECTPGTLPVRGAAEEQVRPALGREVEYILAQWAGLLEEEGGRGLRPHDEVGPRGERGARQLAVPRQGLVLVGRVPLVVLLDVALRQRDPDVSGRAARERGRAAPARDWQRGHQERQHGQRRYEPSEARPALPEHGD